MAPLISRAACVLVVAVLLFSAFDADAKSRRRKKNRHKPPTVALFIVTKGKVSKKLIKKVRRELRKSGGKIGAAKVLEGKKLKRKLRKKPEVLITKCGSSMKCIAKLGKKAKAKEVLYGRASTGEDGTVTIQFVSIGVKSREIERKIIVEIASAKQAKQVIVA